MLADLGFPLNWDAVRTTTTPALYGALSTWIQRYKPTCLIHAHGFVVVLLGRTASEEWRLHYWPAGERKVSGMPAFIHTHNCHVESRILKGRLTNILYDVDKNSDATQPLYKVEYAGDRYVAATSNVLRKTTTRVRTRVRQCEILSVGDSYHIERDDYHEALVSADTSTATLVCMHGRTQGKVFVVGIEGYGDAIEFKRVEHHTLDFGAFLSP